MKVYRIVAYQLTSQGYSAGKETFDVRARSAAEGLRRALRLARENGFLKSRPIEVESLEELSADVQ